MVDRSVSKRLQQSILVYSVLMILAIATIIASASIMPLYSSLQTDQQRNLLFALKTRTTTIEEYLSRAKDNALQIASRTAVRQKLEAYNQGKITLDELVNFSQPILKNALKQSPDLVGISRLDRTGKLVVQVGLPVPDKLWRMPVVESKVTILPVPITLAGKSYLLVKAPISNDRGKSVGTDIVLFSLSRLQQIVEDYTGLGETGETILGTIHERQIQLFFPLRGHRTFSIASVPQNSGIGLALEKAFHQESGLLLPDRSHDRPAVIAYGPIANSYWGIAIAMASQELYAPVRHQIIVIGSVILILIVLGTNGMVLLLSPLTGKMIVHTDELEQLLQEKTASLQAELNQRQRAEAAIHFQAHLLDAVEQAVIATDLDGTITYWNRFAQTLYGWSAAETIGRRFVDVIPAEASKPQVAEIMSRVKHGESWSGEYWVQRRDGSCFPAMVADSPIYGEEGKSIGIVSVSGDISKLKQIEAALHKANEELETRVEERTSQLRQVNQQLHREIAEREQAEERFRIALKNSPIAVFNQDTDLRYTWVYNPGSGFDAEAMVGKLDAEFLLPENAQRLTAIKHRVLVSGIGTREETFLTMNGDVRYYDLTVEPLRNPSGEIVGITCATTDITKCKQAEADIKQLNETLEAKVAERTAQLEATNQELDSFSYSVSHDLRAPLRHIGGFIAALRQQLEHQGTLVNPKIVHYLQVIQDSSVKMGLLIDGLLMLSRLGRRQLDMQPVNTRTLVENAIALVQFQIAPAAKRSIEFDIGELPTLMGDATLLQQVFSNLIDNAVKFSRDQQPARISVGTLQDGTLFVRDNGVGFNMKCADQLFGAFQRLHSQNAFEGTGIGLAIVQRIIHRHGGTLWAESQPERGATFYFKLGQIPEE